MYLTDLLTIPSCVAGLPGLSVPCGIADGGVTTMERASGRRPALIEVVPPLVANFGDVFAREIIDP